MIKTRRAQLFALGGAVLAAAVSATLTVESMRVEAAGEEWVEHTMEARRQIADLGADVRGAGSGIRAFLATKAGSDLDHYHASVASVPRELAALGALTADNPIQRRNIERLEPLVKERFDRLADTLRGVEQTAPVLEATQQLVDRIQAAVGDLDLEERRRLDKRRAEVTLAAQTAEIVSTLGLGLSLGLVLLGWWLQRLELKREVQLTAALTLSRTQLQQLTADLAASNRDLDAFAGRIAHDLKNALTPVAAAAGILRMLGSKKVDNLEATLGDLGGKLTHASSRADMMIDSLLAFSRTGLPTDPVAETIVGVALREVVEGLAPQIASVDATVHLDLEDTVVRCPPGLFNIVAINLIGNALKFLQGMSPRRVRVTARHDERWVVLSIEDSGPGIPSDALERIFEPFYRAHGPDVPGSGIGLATVDRVMRAYGGKVGVRSTLGQGATFEVRFPLLVSASP